ncbi:MAG: methyltransferase, partial [Candidatus Heimdallarchaeaceae archaeon]
WSQTFQAVKEGKEVFSSVYGKPFFEWIEENTEKAELYQKAIESYAKRDYDELPNIVDLSQHKIIMDVGGGSGILLNYILDKYPNLKGILFEQEETIEIAKKSFLNSKIGRCKFISGNFFMNLPKEADAIFLCRILHDWNDHFASQILKNCNRALDTGQKLYVIELILPEDFNDPLGGLLTLNMLTLTNGKERTLKEYQNLLSENGFEVIEIKELKSVSSLIIATKINEI